MILNVLIACEESQTVCKAFRGLGHRAYSCDLQECSGGHPEWHVKGDCLPLLGGDCEFTTSDGIKHYQHGEWNLLIAHPPCTYMSKAGARWMYAGGVLNENRLRLALEGRAFFMKMLNARCRYIAVENPRPLSVVKLPPHNSSTAIRIWVSIQQGNLSLVEEFTAIDANSHHTEARAISAVKRHGQETWTEVVPWSSPQRQSRIKDLQGYCRGNGRTMVRVYFERDV